MDEYLASTNVLSLQFHFIKEINSVLGSKQSPALQLHFIPSLALCLIKLLGAPKVTQSLLKFL